MDPSGKLIYTKNQEVLSGNLQTLPEDGLADGARMPLSVKEIGSTEIYASALLHSPNGRFVTVVGDGEYIIYTALAWRNKAFGQGNSFAWASDSNTYAVLEGKTKVRVYKNFKERGAAGMKGVGSFQIDAVYGGPLLTARGNGFVLFWDWETGEIVRRIDVDAKNASYNLYHMKLDLLTIRNRLSGPAQATLSLSSLTTRTTSSALTGTPIPPKSRRAPT